MYETDRRMSDMVPEYTCMCVCCSIILLSAQRPGESLSTTECLLSSTQLNYNQLSIGTPSEKVKEKKRKVAGVGGAFIRKGKGGWGAV